MNGVTIAYLSYTDHTNGIPQSSAITANVIYTSQRDVMEQQVRRARELADFVVVGVHWGVEDSHKITQTQRDLAQLLSDWGADVILGTHPHVVQDAEWKTSVDGRQTFVAYSLGNFLSTQSKPDQLIGAILTLELNKTTDPDGSVHCAVASPQCPHLPLPGLHVGTGAGARCPGRLPQLWDRVHSERITDQHQQRVFGARLNLQPFGADWSVHYVWCFQNQH